MISVNLQGRISIKDIDTVIEQTNLIFDEKSKIKAPDVLILYQQRIISKTELDKLIERFYSNESFYEVKEIWVNPDIVKMFEFSAYVPLRVDYSSNTIIIGTIPEFMNEPIPLYSTFKTIPVAIKLYEYVEMFVKYFGRNPSFLKELPVSDIFKMLVNEAIELKAADITISQKDKYIQVYYNVNKRKVYSKRTIPNGIMSSLIKYLTAQTNNYPSVSSRKPIYFTLNLDENHRGRTVINYTYWGQSITIRVLSNELHKNTFDSLNIPKKIQQVFKDRFISISPGLKLLAGPTYSGKNTSIITILDELHNQNDIKIVSVENPVEILTDYIEQINAETTEEFKESVDSTLRQNPDLVYISEMTPYTALETMKIANTGKLVLSTIHVNSIAEIPSRIRHLTGLEVEEIMQILDCMVYQELLPIKCPYCGDKGCESCYKSGVIPIFTYLKMTSELRRRLIDKPFSEIYKVFGEETKGKEQLDLLLETGTISQKTYDLRRRE